MNKRKRKKYLKQQGLYINPKETWNLDYEIARFVRTRLELFKKETNSKPIIFSEEEWFDILDKMIAAFAIVEKDLPIWTENEQKQMEEGINLFAKYYLFLWW